MKEHWPTIEAADVVHLNEATDQLHYAAQFIAITGKHLAENKSDDSHTNMGWLQNAFTGHLLKDNPDRLVALEVPSLSLQIHDTQHQVINEFPLVGKSRNEGLAWLQQELSKSGVDTSTLSLQLHYDIPTHPLQEDGQFQAMPEAYMNFCKVRSLGQMVIDSFAANFEHASSIRTWPHHFDLGAYIPIKIDATGEAQTSISLGLAIHDETIEEHYFYITHWKKEGSIDYNQLPDLPSGSYWNRNPWTGAVLKLSDIASIENPNLQKEAIEEFMQIGIKASLELIG